MDGPRAPEGEGRHGRGGGRVDVRTNEEDFATGQYEVDRGQNQHQRVAEHCHRRVASVLPRDAVRDG